jgi:hypothetical protein
LGEVQIEELECKRLRWRAAGGESAVDLVTEKALPRYSDFIAPGIKETFEFLITYGTSASAAQ